ncbi:Leucine-rich repeat, ribonuclease inhibitor subtype [Ascosphaera apis ARSEF 7405]|uniref:Leucine-rich repeat, ribonuclease inhibitor subtype n=1 Tax=Ascosphaera apis ARSEF 7405 TaxID=392613 RepID=A0A167W4G5_9EURO|nr:Leucine-rich repeat, ribonuclease inhibitor subtype [Ascosphaera apis ARSEF 7405]
MASSSIFSIAGKGLKFDTVADLEPHIKPLLDTPDVYTEIHLGGNTYGVPACEYLADALRKQTRLSVAKLDDMFTTRLLTEIPPALKALLTALLEVKTLQTIDLSDNAFGLNTQAPLVDFLKEHTPLRHLYLNNNGLGPNAGVLVADAVAELADKKEKARNDKVDYEVPPLETILCGRNRLETGSMEAWAKAIKKHKDGLKTIKMPQDGIRKDGIPVLLGDGLRYATGIEVIDLQDNTFTITGSSTLAEILPNLTEIRELGVSDCLLSARGFIKVAKALAKGKNTKLEILRLQFNEINDKALKELVGAVKNALPALKKIEINGNVFEEEDPSVVELREVFDDRRKAANEAAGKDEDEDEEEWGLDELDELEEPDSDAEEDEEEEEEEEEVIVKDAEEAENAKVAQEKDKSVDELAKTLDKTSI